MSSNVGELLKLLYEHTNDEELRVLIRKLENECGRDRAQLTSTIYGRAKAESVTLPNTEEEYVSLATLTRIIIENGGSL